jgi:hypothetical protein
MPTANISLTYVVPTTRARKKYHNQKYYLKVNKYKELYFSKRTTRDRAEKLAYKSTLDIHI